MTSADARTLLDGLVAQTCKLSDAAIALESHPALATRRAFCDRIAGHAAEFLAEVFAAEAGVAARDLRERIEAQDSFARCRELLGTLRHDLRIAQRADANDEIQGLLDLANEVMALLMAVTIAVRSESSRLVGGQGLTRMKK